MSTSNDAGGCAVDWSWLVGQEIVEASSDLQRLRLRFASGQTLEVKAASWKGQSFLAFEPWRAAGPGERSNER